MAAAARVSVQRWASRCSSLCAPGPLALACAHVLSSYGDLLHAQGLRESDCAPCSGCKDDQHMTREQALEQVRSTCACAPCERAISLWRASCDAVRTALNPQAPLTSPCRCPACARPGPSSKMQVALGFLR